MDDPPRVYPAARPQLAVLFIACAACNGASPPPTIPISTATAMVEPPLPSAAPQASAAPPAPAPPAAPAGAPPYPEAWIREAEETNDALSCREVIYRNKSCSRPRVGSVTAEITLAPNGKVSHVEQVENTVVNEPDFVWRCLKQKLPKWKLHAPEGVSPTFRLKLEFRDRC